MHRLKIALAAALLLPLPAFAAPPVAAALSSNPTADRFVEVGGTKLRIRDEGPRKGIPIVLIHGYTFSLETWDAWAADLARDHRVIRYDLSGHGLSGADPEGHYTTADREAQLGAVMDKLGIKKAIVAGNSLGGMIAWHFAADHPARVAKLILVDSGGFSINGVTDKPAPVPPPLRAFLTAPSEAGVAFTLSHIYAHPERVTPAERERFRAMIAANGPALIQHVEQFTLPDPTLKLGAIRTPTLILWGEKDPLVPVGDAKKFGDVIPGAKVEIFPDVGHVPQEEAPEATLKLVRDFIGR